MAGNRRFGGLGGMDAFFAFLLASGIAEIKWARREWKRARRG